MPTIPTVVECSTCNTRFRVDRKLIEGYRAARFRCRRCGNHIVITIPDPQGIREPVSSRQRPGSADPPPVSLSQPATPKTDKRRVTTRSSCSTELVTPAVREAARDNLESLDRFREANRIGLAHGEFDCSANITTEILHNRPAPGELRPPAPSAEDPVPRCAESPESRGQTGVLEAALQWQDTGYRRPYTLRYSVTQILCIVVFTATIAYFGFYLLINGFPWLVDVLNHR